MSVEDAMTAIVSVRVYGTPQPQGSAKAYVVKGRARITTGNPKLYSWRDTVAGALVGRCEMLKRPESCWVWVDFFMPRLATMPKKVRAHTTRPDLDKLVRGVLDALTAAGIVEDDSQVTNIVAGKRYANEGEAPGAEITVWRFGEPS